MSDNKQYTGTDLAKHEMEKSNAAVDKITEQACAMLTGLSVVAYKNARDNGWWDKGDRNIGELCMLMVTELAEAYEAYRNNNAPDDKLPEFPGLHVELADCIIRILDYCGREGIPIGLLVQKKMEFNKSRGYRHGGKQA